MNIEDKRKYFREYQQKRRLRNSSKEREYQKNYRDNNKDKRKNVMLKLKFNLTLDEYNFMLDAQSGVCKICGMSETTKKNNSDEVRMLCVDHDHNTGQVRGLLCNRCNRALGHYEASKPRAQEFEKYLEEAIKL
jgi:hypothetical protein